MAYGSRQSRLAIKKHTIAEEESTDSERMATMNRDMALHALDELGRSGGFLRARELADIVGVIAGIKSVAYIYPPYLYDTFAERVTFEGILRALGLHWRYLNTAMSHCAVSRDDVLLRRFHVAYKNRIVNKAYDDPEIEYEIGGLLGYPATATEYFLRRWPTLNTETPLPFVEDGLSGRDEQFFADFVLSPEYYKREIREFVIPLTHAVHRLTPRTYATIVREGALREKDDV